MEMLKAAHVGAVMCNAFPGIAEYGNYVTEHDNNHDGVAEIIHKFILKDAWRNQSRRYHCNSEMIPGGNCKQDIGFMGI